MASERRPSIIQFMGEDTSPCGYCRSGRASSVSSGMWCHTLTVEEYQLLVDRGWRRSGCWLYKPNMQCTCCPQYAIRLDVHKFNPSKEQKRVLKKWESFLAGGPMPIRQAQPVIPQADEAGQDQAGEATFSDKRQKLKREAKPDADSRTGRLSREQPQQHWQQATQAAANYPSAAYLETVAKQAVQACMASGQLPENDIPQVRVKMPSAKQTDKLPEGVRLSSPIALALAGLYRKTQGPSAMTADQVAVQLGIAINARLDQPAWQARHGLWSAVPLRGHINFICSSPSSTALSVTSEQETLANASVTAYHVASVSTDFSDFQPDAAPGSASEPHPQQAMAQAWAGHDLTTSLQAAIADSSAKRRSKFDVRPKSPVVAGAASADRTQAGAPESAGLQAGPSAAAVNSAPEHTKPFPTAAIVSEPAPNYTSESASPRKDLPEHSYKTDQGRSASMADAENVAAVAHSCDQSQVRNVGSSSRTDDSVGRPRNLDIRMVPATPELIPVEFPLYKKYQMTIHGDAPSKVRTESFKRFLVDSPFDEVPCSAYPSGTCPPGGFGTFHQQYWLDGKLIAVGVLDVLPRALSSKYFFWDSDYAALSPGKFSALQEADWVQNVAQQCPALHYYIMGYYVHSCRKMRYKADYQPSDLLCPERLCWIPFARVKATLDVNKYQVLSDVPGATAGLGPEHELTMERKQYWSATLSTTDVPPEVVQASLVFSKALTGGVVRFQDLQHFAGATEEVLHNVCVMLKQWHLLVGPAAADMLFFI